MRLDFTVYTLRWACVICFISKTVFAGAPDRNKAWDALVALAKAHGGIETKLDSSVSLVFQRPDGSYLTLTSLRRSDPSRSVCLVAKDENATACVDWDSGKLTLGSRPDPATPWKFRSLASLAALEAEKPGVFQNMLSTVQGLFLSGGRAPKNSDGGRWVNHDGSKFWENLK